MPEAQIQPSDGASGELRYSRTSFFNGGRNSYLEAPSQDEDAFLTYENIMPPVRGALEYRWGTSSVLSAVNFARYMVPALTAAGVARVILSSSNGTGSSSTSNRVSAVNVAASPSVTTATVFTPASGASTPRIVVSRDWAFFQDGTTVGSRKWNVNSNPALITGMSSWGFVPPVWTGMTATAVNVGSGGITLETGRTYFLIYVNESTGHASDLSVTTAGGSVAYVTIGPITDSDVTITNIPTSPPTDAAIGSGTQITHVYVLATADGGGWETLYYVTKVAIFGSTSYTDTTPETSDSGVSLLTNSIFQETGNDGVARGVVGNGRPPIPTALPNSNVFPPIVKHRGRLFIASGSTLYFSKSLSELTTSTLTTNVGRYEECWPAAYQLDVSPTGAESIRGLLSDGQNLYVATQSRIFVIQGEGPEDFAIPQALHNGVGVSYPDTWQIVYVDNQPVGSIWMTPDNRVILSDFNTYIDIGVPVQDVLNQINPGYMYQSFGAYMGKGVYQFYTLFICFGVETAPQLAVVFDLKSKKWATWLYTGASESFGSGITYINPVDGLPYLLLSSVSTGNLCKFDDTIITDFGNAFTCTLRTPWLNLGDIQTRKGLNCLRFIGTKDSTNVSAVSIFGAVSVTSFVSPATILSSGTPVNSPVAGDTDQLIPLAAKFSNYRFFSMQCTLTPINTTVKSLLSGYELDFMHLDKF